MSKNITTLEQYKKKYRNNKHRLLKYTKKEVEEFDKLNKTKNKYLLNFHKRKWVLIGDTYYEIPKAPRFTWFRNLNAGVQASVCLLGAGVVATGITVPTVLMNMNHVVKKDEEKKDDKIHVKSVFCNENFLLKQGKTIKFDDVQLGLVVLPENATNKKVNIKVTEGTDLLSVNNDTETIYANKQGNAQIEVKSLDNPSLDPITCNIMIRSPYTPVSIPMAQSSFNCVLTALNSYFSLEMYTSIDDIENASVGGIEKKVNDVYHLNNYDYASVENGRGGTDEIPISMNYYKDEVNDLLNTAKTPDVVCGTNTETGDLSIESEQEQKSIEMDKKGRVKKYKNSSIEVAFNYRRMMSDTTINKDLFVTKYKQYRLNYNNSTDFFSVYNIVTLKVYDPAQQEYISADYLMNDALDDEANYNGKALFVYFYDNLFPKLRLDCNKYSDVDLEAEGTFDPNGVYKEKYDGTITYEGNGTRKHVQLKPNGYLSEDDDHKVTFDCDFPYESFGASNDFNYNVFKTTFQQYRDNFLDVTRKWGSLVYEKEDVTYRHSELPIEFSYIEYPLEQGSRTCKLYDDSGTPIDSIGTNTYDETWFDNYIKSTGTFFKQAGPNPSIMYRNLDAINEGDLKLLVISPYGYIEKLYFIGNEYRCIKYDGTPHGRIILTESEVSMTLNETHPLVVYKVYPESLANYVQWYSYDSSVATVDENGLITPQGEGITYIEAYIDYQDYYFSSYCKVTVGDDQTITAQQFADKLDEYNGNFDSARTKYQLADITSFKVNGVSKTVNDISYGTTTGKKNCFIRYIGDLGKVEHAYINASYYDISSIISKGGKFSNINGSIKAVNSDGAEDTFEIVINQNGYIEKLHTSTVNIEVKYAGNPS